MGVPLTLSMLALLLIVARCNAATRIIQDTISLVVVVIGTLVRAVEEASALARSVGTAFLFIMLLLVYSRGMIGGGDVKIMAALAVALAPIDSYRFVVATAFAGGFLAIAYLLLAHRLHALPNSRPTSLLGRVAAVESWRIRRRGPLPHGGTPADAFVLFFPGSF